MWRQDDQPDVLLIDRAAAAELPRDETVREWARDKRAFISSVMAELGEERAAAADGVRSVGARPVMFEEFGGRDAGSAGRLSGRGRDQPDLRRHSRPALRPAPTHALLCDAH